MLWKNRKKVYKLTVEVVFYIIKSERASAK